MRALNNNNNNIYTGGVLTLSGFRNGPVKNIIQTSLLDFLCNSVVIEQSIDFQSLSWFWFCDAKLKTALEICTEFAC